MTRLHDKPSVKESRSLKRQSQAKPNSAPPARRSKRDAAPSAPSQRESHAARPVRPPPTLTRENAHLTCSYTLRTRDVFVSNTNKPGPLQYKKGEEPAYDTSWQTPACAKAALEHYNRLNEDEHELVKAVDSVAFLFNGLWMHANFLAKPKGATSCVDLVPKYFFAELRGGANENGMSCISCVKMDPANPETAPGGGCSICPSRIFHPAAGGHRCAPALLGAAGNGDAMV